MLYFGKIILQQHFYTTAWLLKIFHNDAMRRNYLNNNSQGFSPVCFLNAVEKCDIEE
jgi:hypothetical protein